MPCRLQGHQLSPARPPVLTHVLAGLWVAVRPVLTLVTEVAGEAVAVVAVPVSSDQTVAQEGAGVHAARVVPARQGRVQQLVGNVESVHIIQELLDAQVDVLLAADPELDSEHGLVHHDGSDAVLKVEGTEVATAREDQRGGVRGELGQVEGLAEEVLGEVEVNTLARRGSEHPEAGDGVRERVWEVGGVDEPPLSLKGPPAVPVHVAANRRRPQQDQQEEEEVEREEPGK